MTAVTFIRHGLCAQTRALIFGADGPLDRASRPPEIEVPVSVFRSPSTICEQSCTALGVLGHEDQRLRPFDYGDWNGRSLGSVDSAELLAWRHDLDYDGHGGESVRAFCGRIADFLGSLAGETRAILSHGEVIRAGEVWSTGDERRYWTGDASRLRPWGVLVLGTR